MQHDAVHRRWSLIFGIASLLTPFFLGATLGATGSGAIRVEGGLVRTGFFAGWTGAFAMACGLFAQCLFAFLAATYLTVDTDDRPELQEDFRRRARAAGLALIPAAVPVFGLMGWGLAQYPYLVVPDVTLHNAATEPRTLRLVIIALAAGTIVLVPSLAYLFRVFKTRGASRSQADRAGIRRHARPHLGRYRRAWPADSVRARPTL